MVESVQEAYNVLNLRAGATEDDVINNFRKLALEWHPDKHNRSETSYKKFQKLCYAFRFLTTSDEKQVSKPLSMESMFEMFQEVYIKPNKNFIQHNGFESNNDEEDLDDDELFTALANRIRDLNYEKEEKERRVDEPTLPKVSDEVARRNADSLVAEEEEERQKREEEKKKAEKRRAKKKRRKLKKKLEKENDTDNKQDSSSIARQDQLKNKTINKYNSDVEESESEEELDPNSAFVATAVNKNKTTSVSTTRTIKNSPKDPKEASEKKDDVSSVDDTDPLILQSRKLAIRGNEMANVGNFQAAVELFSEAIRMNPHDFRFYGNRSFCYDKLGLFDKALKDADKAILVNADWPKNYHRKGRALAGLKRYAEAEESFEQVLKLDKDCEDALQELRQVRTDQIVDMGFTKEQADQALKWYGSVQAAIDALCNGSYAGATASAACVAPTSEVYVSDDESHIPASFNRRAAGQQHYQQQGSVDVKLDPRNPEGLTSLWVGNISKDVKEKQLQQLFQQYGHVMSLRMIPDKFCSFINYADKLSAGKAMKALQGLMFGGQPLYIRFPDKPITNGHQPIIIKKNNTKTTVSQPTAPKVTNGGTTTSNGTRVTGPVNGDECYFWRTTGCAYGNNCRLKHLPEHKSIDKKPWQAPLY